MHGGDRAAFDVETDIPSPAIRQEDMFEDEPAHLCHLLSRGRGCEDPQPPKSHAGTGPLEPVEYV